MNSAVPFWFQSADEGGDGPVPPQPGAQIGSSLRFGNNTGTRRLTRTTAAMQTSWTASWWFKAMIETAPAEQLLWAPTGGGTQYFALRPNLPAANDYSFNWQGLANIPLSYRDPSAWGHWVIQQTPTESFLYLNGVLVSNPSTATTTNCFAFIGCNQNPTGFEGLMSEFRVVDGQALGPETFGQFDTQGAWQPRRPAVINTAVGDYGAQGFYLPMNAASITNTTANSAVRNIIVLDEAPIDTLHSAANNYDGVNFTISPVGRWSDMLFSSAANPINFNSTSIAGFTTSDAGGFGRAQCFDGAYGGNGGSNGQVDSNNFAFIWRPTTPITNVTSLAVYGLSADVNARFQFFLNSDTTAFGTVNGAGQPVRTVLTLPAGFNGTIENIAVTQDAAGITDAPGWQAIEINGVVYLNSDPIQRDILSDSPSSNYATLNPLVPNYAGTTTAANLDRGNMEQLGGSQPAIATIPATANKYWEFRANGTNCLFGLMNQPTDEGNSVFGSQGITYGPTANSFQARGAVATSSGAWPGYADGNTVSFGFDGTTLTGYIQGVAQVEATGWEVNNPGAANDSGPYYPFVEPSAGNLATAFQANFGQQPFQFAPAGVTADFGLTASGLPNPPINDGSDGFRALQAAGTAIRACCQGELNDQHGSAGFGSGMYWIKDVVNNNNWQCLDTLRGGNNAIVFNTNSPGFQNYTEPAGNSIGYAWNVTGVFTPASTGGLTAVSGLRSLEYGISLIRWTGGGNNNATIAHGFDQEPVCKWWVNLSNAATGKASTYSFFPDDTQDQALFFNANQPLANQGGGFISGDATNYTLVDGTSNRLNVNEAGDEYWCCSFIPISGYSDFGVYVGNGEDPDGPFIQTNFTPSLVILKADANTNWNVYDSTLNNSNAVSDFTSLDNNLSDTTGFDVDFLSNGFKLKANNGDTNSAGISGVYWAFAAQPFGGGNVQPIVSQLQSPQPTPADPGVGVISNSLRFRGTQSLTNTTLGTPTTWTTSYWVKRALLGPNTTEQLISMNGGNCQQRFQGSDALMVGSGSGDGISTALFRDVAAWYHIVVSCNSAVGTGSTRVWVNGQELEFNPATQVMTGGGNTSIGLFSTTQLNGYLADIYFIDGQSLQPTDFGNYNAEGVWVPRTEAQITASINAAGGYGDAGFKLIMNQSNITFGDTPVLQDQSGNNNDFDMNGGFVLIDETNDDFDLMVDGPSTNFSTLNPLTQVNPTSTTNNGNPGGTAPYRNANLEGNSAGIQNGGPWQSSAAIPGDVNTTYYFEVFMQSVAGGFPSVGVMQATQLNQSFTITPSLIEYMPNGNIQQMPDNVNDTAVILGTADTYTTGDIISASLNTSTNSLIFFKNGVQQFEVNTYDFSNQLTLLTARLTGAGDSFTINYGQQPFQHQPEDTVAVQQRNMADAPVADGSDCFRVVQSAGAAIRPVATGVLNDGNGSTGFSSGLYWIKETAANNTTQWQFTTTLTADQTYLSPQGTSGTYTAPPGESFAWCWEAGQAFTGTNVVSGLRNTDGGFSMVLYTGDGNATQAIEHGLGAVPGMTTVFDRGANNGYRTFVTGMTVGQTTSLDSPAVATATTTFSAIDATSVTVEGNQNTAGHDYMLWTWAAVSGYSAMGTYFGNGSADGTFVYTGFTPHGLLVKRNSGGNGSPVLYDSTRNDSNPVDFTMILSEAGAQEGGTDAVAYDFLANGFKVRNTDNSLNNQGSTYMYAAWGAQPFGGSNVQPMTAGLQSPQATPTSVQDLNSRSLRFRGAQGLTNVNNLVVLTNYTFSWWVKLAEPLSSNTMWLTIESAQRNDLIQINPDLNLAVQRNQNANNQTSSSVYRDFSAWMHITWVRQGDTGRVFVNGNPVPGFVAAPIMDTTAVPMQFGFLGPNNAFHGYLADAYFTTNPMKPTDFGRYNDDGVWTPRTEADITTAITNAGGYGDQGFKLIMRRSNVRISAADPILEDQSGNGNNFNMTGGFEVADTTSVNYDFMVDGTTTNYPTFNPVAIPQGFSTVSANLADANLQVGTPSAGATDPSAFATQLIEGQQYFEVTVTSGNSALSVYLQPEYDTTLANPGTQNRIATLGGANFGTATTLDIRDADGTQSANLNIPASTVSRILGFAVNTATGDVQVFLDGDLQDTATGYTGTRLPTVVINGQTGAYEVYLNCGQQPFRFAVPAGFNEIRGSNMPPAPIADPRDHFQVIVTSGTIDTAGANEIVGNFSQYLTPVRSNFVTPQRGPANAFDGDGNTFAQTADAGAQLVFAPEPPITFTDSVKVRTSIDQCVAELGDVTTAELPTNQLATVVTGVAGEISANNPLIISNPANNRAQNISQIAVDDNILRQLTISGAARTTFGSGFYIIKNIDDNSTPWQFLDAANGDNCWESNTAVNPSTNTYVNPAGAYSVAYCWNASGAATINTNGDIPSTVRSDQVAGFSIVEYTMPPVPASVEIGHGLDATPGLIWITNYSQAQNCIMYHQDLAAGNALDVQRGTVPFASTFMNNGPGNFTRPTNQVFTVGANNAQVSNPNDRYMAYCWAAVSGYSAFGVYEGNQATQGNTDVAGPLIYTGFSPEFVWIKGIGAAESYTVRDNVIGSGVNNNTVNLSFNLESRQTAPSDSHAIEFLSNGFTPRGGDGQINFTNSSPYIWAAWAKSPFGGSNVTPATAR